MRDFQPKYLLWIPLKLKCHPQEIDLLKKIRQNHLYQTISFVCCFYFWNISSCQTSCCLRIDNKASAFSTFFHRKPFIVKNALTLFYKKRKTPKVGVSLMRKGGIPFAACCLRFTIKQKLCLKLYFWKMSVVRTFFVTIYIA